MFINKNKFLKDKKKERKKEEICEYGGGGWTSITNPRNDMAVHRVNGNCRSMR